MIVKTLEEAWEKVNKMVITAFVKDVSESYHAGHVVYRNEANDSFVEDLGCRLQVTIEDMTTSIWIADNCIKEVAGEIEEEIAETAEEIAKWITLNLDK